MSDTEETNERKLDSDASAAQPQEVTENAAEKSEQKASSSPAPAEKNAILYGTRKRRPGASNASAAKTLDQIRGAYDEDEVIEMDDLVVKATAPSHLVSGDRPASSNRRERNDRSDRSGRRDRNDRPNRRETEEEHSSEEPAIDASIEAYPDDETSEKTEAPQDDRPERFATLSENQRPTRRPVEEFRPSTDGKRAEPKKSVRSEERPARYSKQPQKKGFFAWLKSLFSSEDETKQREERRPGNRGPNQRRRRGEPNRDGDDRNREGGERPNRPRGGRRRSRGPRSDAEGGEHRRHDSDNRNREGGERRRRRRRPQGERHQPPSE